MRRMISSRPISCHVLHCCSMAGILKWMDLWNTESPPATRLVTAAALVVVSAAVSTGLCLSVKKWKASGPNVIKDVRKKSRKCSVGLGDAASSGNEIADSGSELIELSAERKLTKGTAELAVTVISFAVFLHVVAILLGAPFIRFAQRTAALSCTIAALTLLPLVHEADKAQQPFGRQFADLILVGSGGSVSMERMHLLSVLWGTWFACLLHKLDWKQVWQEYPVPGLSGAVIASLCSHVTYLTEQALLFHANY